MVLAVFIAVPGGMTILLHRLIGASNQKMQVPGEFSIQNSLGFSVFWT